MPRIPERTQYENELVHLLEEADRKWYAATSGNNQGADVLLQRGNGEWGLCIQFEVKTSINMRIPITGHKRTRKQRARYRKQWNQYRVPTWYGYRLITRKKMTTRQKWRFIHISQVAKSIKWEDGITWRSLLRRLKTCQESTTRRGSTGKSKRG